ncbi:MAG: UDP-N-acetylmuramoyl-L-alanine--D-glutamate ligase, partial [Candidatus Kapaibacterium sp.]
HLDRYVSFDEYANAKYNITKNQSENDIIILNYDDLKLKELIPNKGVKKLYFSLTNEVPIGAFLKNNKIFLKIENSEGIEFIEVIDVKDIFIIGSHNYANAMVAMLIAYSMKVPFEIICKGLKEFKGVSHRLEQVRKLKGVKYVNDSKATNVDATEVALKSFEEPIILIAGGISKKNNYDSIIELIKSRVKAVVLIGIASDEMNLAFEGITKIVKAGNELENALRIAQNIAEDGDVVLLSPACASFDMFNNYEHRGDVFKELVMNLK